METNTPKRTGNDVELTCSKISVSWEQLIITMSLFSGQEALKLYCETKTVTIKIPQKNS